VHFGAVSSNRRHHGVVSIVGCGAIFVVFLVLWSDFLKQSLELIEADFPVRKIDSGLFAPGRAAWQNAHINRNM